MTTEDLDEVTDIHMENLVDDFITSLGRDFVKDVYYGSIFQANLGFGLVAKQDARIAGFIVGSYNSKRVQLVRLRKHWKSISQKVFLMSLRNPIWLMEVLGVVVTMQGKQFIPENSAELVSLCVRPAYRGKKLAGALIHSFKEYLKSIGFGVCWTKTHSETAMKVYEASGFRAETVFRINERDNTLFTCQLF